MLKIDAIKASILNYVNHFGMYDYIAYAWLILLFFVTILLAILVARKSPTFSILIVIISLALLFVGPFVLKHYLDIFIRPTIDKVIEVKKLTFSNTLIVTGSLTNVSTKSFSTCSVDINVLKHSSNDIKNFVNQLKPLLKKTIFIDKSIDINETKELRVVFDGYNYKKDINVSIKSECY